MPMWLCLVLLLVKIPLKNIHNQVLFFFYKEVVSMIRNVNDVITYTCYRCIWGRFLLVQINRQISLIFNDVSSSMIFLCVWHRLQFDSLDKIVILIRCCRSILLCTHRSKVYQWLNFNVSSKNTPSILKLTVLITLQKY